MEIKNRQTTLMIVAGTALALLVGDNFIVEPLRASWKSRADEIKKLENDVKNGTNLLTQKDRLESRWQNRLKNIRTYIRFCFGSWG